MTEDDGPVDGNRNRNDGGPVDERRGEDGDAPRDETGHHGPGDEAFAHEGDAGDSAPDGAAVDDGLPVNRRELVIGGGVAGALLLGGAVGVTTLTGDRGGKTPSTGTSPPTAGDRGTPVGYGGTPIATTAAPAPGAVTDTDAPTGTPVDEEYGGVGYGGGLYGGSAP